MNSSQSTSAQDGGVSVDWWNGFTRLRLEGHQGRCYWNILGLSIVSDSLSAVVHRSCSAPPWCSKACRFPHLGYHLLFSIITVIRSELTIIDGQGIFLSFKKLSWSLYVPGPTKQETLLPPLNWSYCWNLFYWGRTLSFLFWVLD